MMQNYYLPLKAPTPLPAQGVDTVTFKVWKNTLTAHLEQDSAHYHFLNDGRYSSWIARDMGKRITILVEDDPDKKTLDEKKNAGTLTEQAHTNAKEVLLVKRNAQLAKFITHIATLCYYTEHDDITMQSTSLESIFDYLTRHYGLETKGANFLKIAEKTYKKGEQHQTFYKQYRASFIDNLRKKHDKVKYKNDHVLAEDEQLSPSFENAIVLWALKEIDPRLPAKVKKSYAHQMTGNTTLMDLQPVIFQNITSMLEELDDAQSSKAFAAIANDPHKSTTLNALNQRSNFKGNSRGTGNRFQRGGKSSGFQSRISKPMGSRGDKPFCRVCKLAGSDERVFTSHEIGNCSRLTVRDMESLRNSLVLNGMITEETVAECSITEEPIYELQPGWDDDEAAGLVNDDHQG